MSLDLDREVWWTPAWDKRSQEPGKNYGVHGMEITFVLRSADRKAGLTFTIMTNWMLPHVEKEWDESLVLSSYSRWRAPIPSGVALHRYAGGDDEQTSATCEVVGGPCKGDGSYTLGREFFDLLVREGAEALWVRMGETMEGWLK